MAGKLTAIGVKNATCPPDKNRREIPDGASLYLVVQPSGVKGWAYRYKNADGVQRKLTLGSFPAMSLETARVAARASRAAVDAGGDPAALKTAARVAKRPTDQNMVENAVAGFVAFAKLQTRPSTLQQTEYILKREIVARWSGKPLIVVQTADVRQIMRTYVTRGKAASARRTLATIRPFFKWAVSEEIIASNPCDGVGVPTQPTDRDRALSDLELRAVWQAASQLGYPFGFAIQLLIILGQRRNEVGEIADRELDLGAAEWLLPGERAKNGKPHLVHLPKLALKIIGTLPRIEGSPFLFTTTGETAISGWGKAKKTLDARIEQNGFKIEPWTLHDLRRTFASGCARIGIAPQVVDAVLNHKAGTIRGVARVYLRYDYAAERKAALDAWAAYLERYIIGDGADNVVELKALRQ